MDMLEIVCEALSEYETQKRTKIEVGTSIMLIGLHTLQLRSWRARSQGLDPRPSTIDERSTMHEHPNSKFGPEQLGCRVQLRMSTVVT